jgi:hypothetical protein
MLPPPLMAEAEATAKLLQGEHTEGGQRSFHNGTIFSDKSITVINSSTKPTAR